MLLSLSLYPLRPPSTFHTAHLSTHHNPHLVHRYVLLSTDVTVMVVQPIESMVGLVRRLAENPTLQLEGQSKSKYETENVRIALAKIVGLMQLGFGGAGHEIISANLANAENTGLDLMLRGKKRECAYGFCDIRQFTDTVECLQDQVCVLRSFARRTLALRSHTLLSLSLLRSPSSLPPTPPLP